MAEQRYGERFPSCELGRNALQAGAVGLVCKVVAVILVALWPVVTSHSLLSHGGLIHVVHSDHHNERDRSDAHQHLYHHQHDEHDHDDEGSHEHNGDNHEFADGDYRSTSASKLILKPSLITLFTAGFAISALIQQCEFSMESPGPAPPGSTPQILQQTWQFSNRAAIPVRAPSIIS